MVIAILNTPNVFRFSSPQSTTVRYDVSDLLPFTSTHEELIDSQKSAKLHQVSANPKDSESHANLDVDSKGTSSASIAEMLVKVEAHKQVAVILDTSPFKNIIDSYWGAYQKLFAAAFLIHIAVMAIYSYIGVVSLGCAKFNSTSVGEVGFVRTWDLEFGSVISLIWPICLLIYDIVKVVKLLIKCSRVGGYKILKGYQTEGEHLFGYLILQSCGFVYSIMTVVWYILNRYCNSNQDYILAISYIFGWVYAINFTRGFKQVHHFSIILQHILFRDMLRFGLIYLFILLGFSFAYAALVQAIPSLTITSGAAIFSVFNWMIGMADFETNSDEFAIVNKAEWMVQCIYAAYVILSTIVLLNLLIAMMSDSYADVRKMSEVMWKIGSLRLPLEFEESLGRSYYRPKHLNRDFEGNRWYIDIAKKELVERKSSPDAVIHDLNLKVDKLVEESRVRESRVLALLQSKGIEMTNPSDN